MKSFHFGRARAQSGWPVEFDLSSPSWLVRLSLFLCSPALKKQTLYPALVGFIGITSRTAKGGRKTSSRAVAVFCSIGVGRFCFVVRRLGTSKPHMTSDGPTEWWTTIEDDDAQCYLA